MRRWGFFMAPKTPKMAEYAASSLRFPALVSRASLLQEIAAFTNAREGGLAVRLWCASGAPVGWVWGGFGVAVMRRCLARSMRRRCHPARLQGRSSCLPEIGEETSS
jgi:hypothetical protein